MTLASQQGEQPAAAPSHSVRSPVFGRRRITGSPPIRADVVARQPRRRGPRSKFMTANELKSEYSKIVELLSMGMKVADVAASVDISVATLYRRLKAGSDHKQQLRWHISKKFIPILVDLMAINETQISKGVDRINRRLEPREGQQTCCENCRNASLTLALIETTSRLHWSHIRFLDKLGLFDEFKKQRYPIKKMAHYASGKARKASHAHHRTEEKHGFIESLRGSVREFEQLREKTASIRTSLERSQPPAQESEPSIESHAPLPDDDKGKETKH